METLELGKQLTRSDESVSIDDYWLVVDGVTVAWAKVAVFDKYGDFPDGIELHDIETRSEYRHRGYATRIMEMIAEKHSVEQLSHGGGYTPDGLSYISGKLQRPTRETEAITSAEFRPMDFVTDWERHWAC